MASRTSPSAEVDVLIVGAGISGIGLAAHLASARPDTSFVILEGREEIGGTWSLFRYPGIRSDSDMPTFGYGFKPWSHRTSIAQGHLVLDYLRDTVDEHGLGGRIELGQRVQSADFDSRTGRWTVTTSRGHTVSSRFLFLGTGYYDYDTAHTPSFPGVETFRGTVVHPQFWPDDLDCAGQQVVVIGSGATAVTLVPSLAERAGHVTMLQRSPSYVLSVPAADPISNLLNRLLGRRRAHPIIRRKNVWLHRALFTACMRAPRLMRRLLISQVRAQLPRHFDVDTHFTPSYDPWEQRLCMVPDGDLFAALRSGSASVMTDRIATFTPDGILLESGQEVIADVVVTATGLNLLPFGGIDLHVDGRPIHLPDLVAFRSMMLSGVPNLAFALGYTNISWTLKVDLVAAHLCRLLDHMDEEGHDVVVPRLEDPAVTRRPMLDLQAGYVRRGIDAFPRAGDRGPWSMLHDYATDVERLGDGPVTDPALHFSSVRTSARPSDGPARHVTLSSR